ncbi:glycoside hydrolase family 43 protein [Pollutibacter soli]|uniref:glycoside hydrolase family 43 protein n=1 Tax=Pollutibacter soli TaxID=3034157 RepID=UPI0030133810
MRLNTFPLIFRLIVITVLFGSSQPLCAQSTFTNPLLESGPDPWVIQRNGLYFFTSTTGNSIVIRKTHDITGLASAEKKVVYTPPPTGMYSRQLWAPELHHVRGKWYLYYAADNGDNKNHRIYVLENEAQNPLTGEWVMKGKLADPGDHWAIDLTVIEHNERLYAAWSGWDGYVNGMQRLYIAELSDPWTMKGDRVEIAKPQFDWELHGDVPEDWQRNGEVPKVLVNEGPEFIVRNGKVFITYSANACWLDYSMGLLEADTGSNLLSATSWKKHPEPVFVQSRENAVFAPGHNGFFISPDGRQDWIIFHANKNEKDGCGNKRAPYIQQFTWTQDGRPDFGKPLPRTPMIKPSGTPH